MSRLGLAPAELAPALMRLREAPQLRLAGLCTHFASPDAGDPATTEAALALFQTAVEEARQLGFTHAVRHAANSAAAVRFPAARLDAVRPGLALYGAMPSAVVQLPGLEPALALRTRIMAVREIEPGTGGQLRGDLARGTPDARRHAAHRLCGWLSSARARGVGAARRAPRPRDRRRLHGHVDDRRD